MIIDKEVHIVQPNIKNFGRVILRRQDQVNTRNTVAAVQAIHDMVGIGINPKLFN